MSGCEIRDMQTLSEMPFTILSGKFYLSSIQAFFSNYFVDDEVEPDPNFEDEDDKAKSRSAKKQSFFLEFDTGEVLLAGSSLLFLFNCFAVQRPHRK